MCKITLATAFGVIVCVALGLRFSKNEMIFYSYGWWKAPHLFAPQASAAVTQQSTLEEYGYDGEQLRYQ